MSNKNLITEVNDNVEGTGASVKPIIETQFPAGMKPLEQMPTDPQKIPQKVANITEEKKTEKKD